MPFLLARGIHKGYQDNGQHLPVLRGLDLAVERGEFLTIFGASGSGKSTLLHLLGALDRPTAGEVHYDGKELYRQNDAALARFRNRQVGFVFQFYHLLPELTALENVMLPALIGGRSRREAATSAREILSDIGLANRATHRPRELSGGEQQRVALARALVQRPPLLLADEPTGNLDEASGRLVMELLTECWRTRGMTVIMVTHNPDLIRAASRRSELKGGVLHEPM
ncbi:MAG: ABC transporter ATP-binding protein [Deltaproteobacteria bacterium]|nr:ABC transporter ATP-binding protein [Deltaproteobacteria bacterium]